MAYNPYAPVRRFGLEDEDERAILDSATRSVMGDVRAPASIPLTGPPVIDLGDDAEVIIPRGPIGDNDEILGAAVRGVRDDIRAADPRASATSALTGAPSYGLADDDEAPASLFNVQPRPVSVREPMRSLSSTPAAPRFAPPPEPAGRFSEPMVRRPRDARGIAPLPGGPLPRLSEIGLVDDDRDMPGATITRADGTSYVVGPDGREPAATAAAPSGPDDEVIGADVEDMDADADLSVSEPVDPRRRAKLFGPAPVYTSEEESQIQRGRELDQRAARGQRIAAGVAGGLGLLGLLTGSDVAMGLGQAAAGAGGAIPTDVEDQMRARAEARRVREQGGIDRENALVNADNEAMRQDAMDAQRAQIAASEMSVNAERARALQAEQADAEFERQALAGNADGMRAAIRARAAAVQHGPTRQAWEQRFADGGPLDQMTDLASLRTILAEVGDTDVRRGGQGAGGSGGGSERTVTDPRTGITTTVRSGSAGQQQRPAPSGASRSARPRPGAPAPAPTGSAPDATATPSPEQQYLDELRVMTEAYPDLRDGEFDIARTAVMRNRLSISDLTSPDTRRRAAAQGVVRTAIQRYRAGTDATRERMQAQAQSTYATQVGGDVAMPETVEPSVFAPLAQRAEPVYQEYVAPFLQARRSLEAARRAGVGEAGILLALQGANNDTIANFIRERGVRDPNAARALQRLKNSAANMREMYGRTQSGAAISLTEWSQFQNIMGMNHLYLNGSAQFQAAMEDLEQNGRRIVSSRFTPAGEYARDYVEHFYRSLANATGGR